MEIAETENPVKRGDGLVNRRAFENRTDPKKILFVPFVLDFLLIVIGNAGDTFFSGFLFLLIGDNPARLSTSRSME